MIVYTPKTNVNKKAQRSGILALATEVIISEHILIIHAK